MRVLKVKPGTMAVFTSRPSNDAWTEPDHSVTELGVRAPGRGPLHRCLAGAGAMSGVAGPSPISAVQAARVFRPFAFAFLMSSLFRVVNNDVVPNLAAEMSPEAGGLGFVTSACFLTVAGARRPLGILLDRIGPRRTEALLPSFAAAGAVVFFGAGSITGLVIGRSLIGLGVAARLMAAFEAFVPWFPRVALTALPVTAQRS